MNVDGYVSLLARLIEDNEPALVAARVDRFVTQCITQLTIFAGALDYRCRRCSVWQIQCAWGCRDPCARIAWFPQEHACTFSLPLLFPSIHKFHHFFSLVFFFSCWLFENYRESSDYVWQSGRDNLWRKARRFSFIGWGLSLGVQRELRAFRALNIIQNFY